MYRQYALDQVAPFENMINIIIECGNQLVASSTRMKNRGWVGLIPLIMKDH